MSEDITVGDLRLSPSRLTLSCRGDVTVQPLVMDVLMALAASEDVVSREELESQVWRGAHVGYHALPRAISQARRGLAAIHSGARIEAVSKRGYRFVPLPLAAPAGTTRRVWISRLPPASWVAIVVTIGMAMHAADIHGSMWHFLALAVAGGGLSVSLAGARPA